ncbi:disease resistance protein RPV1-like [Eucalyptus grandis]|uniref:disease resistance protein RPV1-like n=1 Tax=Eucalyptus grandis TaxID=71139 RepID=UPI00192E9E3A|nr:disease resistance protein RPV1-like [Eucalyptus grandis]
MVVKAVSKKLKEAFQLVATKQLVGIDETVADILRSLDGNPSATQIVGIHGMGGIGKTTLAKVVYNKLCDQFQHHSFIADIREFSRHNGILCLQKQLIWDIQGTKDEVPNYDVAIRILESRFTLKKVLILLDDVNNHYQLKALIGKHDWFERGSRIIITTRNMSILDDAEVNYKYDLNVMVKSLKFCSVHDLNLCSGHDFRRNSPTREFKSLSHDVISIIGGLPLALEVVGSMKRLRKVPHKEVQEKLRISYDTLNDEEKEIFLDIACFFIGTDLRIASYMWEACNFYPSMGIETLRKLKKFTLRPFVLTDASQVAKELKVLKLKFCYNLKVTPDLSTFRNLEILIFADCFRLKQIHHSIGEVRSLISLDLSECGHLQVLPREMGKLKELKELNIDKTAIEEIPPCIGSLKKLEILHARGCKSLVRLPDSIGHLINLSTLCVRGCKSFVNLPDSIGHLINLSTLCAHGCTSLVNLPNSIGHLINLLTLELNVCISLAELLGSIGSLLKLQCLKLGDGEKIFYWQEGIIFRLNGVPHTPIGRSTTFCPLRWDCMSIRELPESIGDLQNLKILDISTSKLSNLPSTIGKLGNLEELHASSCTSLAGEFPINGLSSLKILVLSWTGVSGFSDSLDKLSHLEKLDLCGCEKLQSLPEIMSKLPSLQHLRLICCNKLQSLPELPSCLTVLEVTCQLRILPQLFHLIHLKELTVYKCKLLESIPKLPSAISKLFIYGCDELKGLPSFSSLKLLSELDIQNCCELTEIKGLEALKSLVHLSVFGSEKLSKFDGLEYAESLGYLDMSFSLVNDDLIRVQGVDRLKSLEELDIRSCEYLIRPDLSQLTHLKQLHAKYCHNLVEIKGLERLENLECLDIERCTFIEILPDLSCFNNLEYLNIVGCLKLRDVQGLEKVGYVHK